MSNRQSYLDHLNKINNQTYKGRDERGSYRASGNYKEDIPKEDIPRGYSKTLKKDWTKQFDDNTKKFYYINNNTNYTTWLPEEAYQKINTTSSADDAGRRQLENARDLEAKARAKQQRADKKTKEKKERLRANILQQKKQQLINNDILDWEVYFNTDVTPSKLWWYNTTTGEKTYDNPMFKILNERKRQAKEKEKARIEAEKKKRAETNKRLAEEERKRRRAEINAISKAPAGDLLKFEPKTPPRRIPRPKTPVTRIGFGSKDSNDELSKSQRRNQNRANKQVFHQGSELNRQRRNAQNSERRRMKKEEEDNNPHHHVIQFIQKAISAVNHAPPTTGLSPYQKKRAMDKIILGGNHETAKSIYNIIPNTVIKDHKSLSRELGNKEILDNSIKRKLAHKLAFYQKSIDTVTDRKGHRHIIHVPYYENKNWMSWVTIQKTLAENKINKTKAKTDDKNYALNRLKNFFHYYYAVFPVFHQNHLENSRNENRIPKSRPGRSRSQARTLNPIPKGQLQIPGGKTAKPSNIPPPKTKLGPKTNLKKAVLAMDAAKQWRKRKQHKYLMYKTATFTLTKKEPYDQDKYILKIVGVDGEHELTGQEIPDHILQGKWKEVDATNFENLYRTDKISLQLPEKLKYDFKDNINFYKHLTSNRCFERDKVFIDGKEITDPVQIRKKLNLPGSGIFPALRQGNFTQNYWISQKTKDKSVWSQNLKKHTNEIRFTPATKGHGGQQWKGEKTKDNPKGKAYIDTNKGINLKNGWFMFELQNILHDNKTKEPNAVMDKKVIPILFFIEKDYVTIPDDRNPEWASNRKILCEYEYRKIWVDKWSKNTANQDFIRRIVDFNTTYNYCSSDNSKYKSITSICTSNPTIVLEKWKSETKEKIENITNNNTGDINNVIENDIKNLFTGMFFKTHNSKTILDVLKTADSFESLKTLCINLVNDVSIGSFLENTINVPNLESPVEEIKQIHESNKTSINSEIVRFIDNCVEDLEKLNIDCKTGDDCIKKINTNINILKNFKITKQNEFQKIISQYDDWIKHYKSFMKQDNELDIELQKDIQELEQRKKDKTSEFKRQIESEALKTTLTELINVT